MTRTLLGAALVLALGLPATAQTRPLPVPVPVVLPPAPPAAPINGMLVDARLAIARAQQIDAAAAQNASFQYFAAVQQLRAGNVAGANISAREALSTALQAQVQAITLPPPASAPIVAPQVSAANGILLGSDPAIVDADAFLALARGTLDDCTARHDRRAASARLTYERAKRAFAAGDWQATRVAAKAAIDACTTTTQK